MYRQIKTIFSAYPWVAVFIAGALLPFAFAPSAVLPVACVAYYFFWIHMLRASDWRAAFATGWWFGFGQFVIGLYWIGNAVLIEADTFWWLLPFAVLLFPAGLAFFIAIPAAIWAALRLRLGTDNNIISAIILAALLALAELARGTILTGFPWNNIAMVWGSWLWLSQISAWTGFYGLSLIVLLWLMVPVALWAAGRQLFGAIVSVFVLVVAIGLGLWRLEASPPQQGGPRIAIVQPHIEQGRKLNVADRQAILRELLDLTEQAVKAEAEYVIWPETAVPFMIDEEPAFAKLLSAKLPPETILITGAIRRQKQTGQMISGVTEFDYYNSAQLWRGGALRSLGDKRHLVPFGEYLPLQNFLESFGFEQLTRQRGGFTAGASAPILSDAGGIRFLALICYEAIFPIGSLYVDDADVIVNLTNDAWFGETAGPHQHLAQARLRAIEARRPLIRAANTGVSAVFDHMGRRLGRLDLGKKGVLIVRVPLGH